MQIASQRWLRLRRQQIKPQIRFLYCIGFLSDEHPTIFESLTSTGERESDQQAHQTKDCCPDW